MLMACRYAYYCHATSIISDQHYDELEKEYEVLHGKLPVGSSKKEDYTPAQRSLAMYFLFSGRTAEAAGVELL